VYILSGIFCPCLHQKNVEFFDQSDGLIQIGGRWRCTLGSSEYAYAVRVIGVGNRGSQFSE